MSTPLNVLIVEDNPHDAELMRRELRRAGYDPIGDRIETENDYRARLDPPPDIILSDFNMPEFDAISAIEILKQRHLEIPIIIVSGSIGEERAVQIIQRGATDYVVKDNMTRLGLAVTNALEKSTSSRDKQRAVRALNESESRFKELADCMPQIVFSARPDGHLDYYNKRWTEFTGLPANVGGDASWSPVLHPDDLKECHERWYSSIESGTPYEHEIRFKDTTGQYRWQLARAVPIRDAQNNIIRWFGTCTDIHRQKLAEVNDHRLAAIVESSQDAIFTMTRSGTILTWNSAAKNIFGYSEQEIIGQSFILLHTADKAEASLGIIATAAAGESISQLEANLIKKDGTLISVSNNVSPVRDSAGNITAVAFVAHDISEQKKLEAQLRQSMKMDAIGRLAGGIAHDFNNLLTVILGRAELTESHDLQDKTRKNVTLIHQTAKRAALLTRQLLQFSRQQVLTLEVVDLNAVVHEMREMLRRLITEDIELAIKTSVEPARIEADIGQIQQVIMNLVVNARDAMTNGGRLTIETGHIELDEQYCSKHGGAVPGPHVMIAFGDTGCGMDEKVRAQIFEPFFTTKEQGKGTGLGLSTVYGIVKQCGGNIYVYSELNHGTVFKVYFPEVLQAERASFPSSLSLPVQRGGETVLLVEDEDGIRELLNEILTSHGYTVISAADGVEAVRCSENHTGEIHLLLTDVVMPNMNGKEVADRILQKRENIRVLFMSGYTSDAIVNRGVLNEGIEFLEKPFSPTSVARRVREVLNTTKTLT